VSHSRQEKTKEYLVMALKAGSIASKELRNRATVDLDMSYSCVDRALTSLINCDIISAQGKRGHVHYELTANAGAYANVDYERRVIYSSGVLPTTLPKYTCSIAWSIRHCLLVTEE
jgi:hypothetical protein